MQPIKRQDVHSNAMPDGTVMEGGHHHEHKHDYKAHSHVVPDGTVMKRDNCGHDHVAHGDGGHVPHSHPQKPVVATRGGADVEYTCPMHPQVRQIGPGNCPICGMALEPVLATADTGDSPELREMTRRFWIGLALT